MTERLLQNERDTLRRVQEAIRNAPHRFDMTTSCHYPSNECGSVMCIGGFAYFCENLGATADEIRSFVLSHDNPEARYEKLFYPQVDNEGSIYMSIYKATVAEAVIAIDNFLADPDADPWAFIEVKVNAPAEE